MKKTSLIILAILTFMLASCGDKGQNAGKPGDVLSGPALDAVDLVIVTLAMNGASPHPELSASLADRLSKYNGNTTFELSGNKIGQSPLNDNGVPGIQIVLLPGAEFKCAYKGLLRYTISLSDGEFGIQNKEIYVKDGTKLSIDGKPYIFSKGGWRKSV